MGGFFSSLFKCNNSIDVKCENERLETKLKIATQAASMIRRDVEAALDDDILSTGIDIAVSNIIDDKTDVKVEVFAVPEQRKHIRVMTITTEIDIEY